MLVQTSPNVLTFAFYKARPGRIADRIIRLASWSRYSHVEFVLDQSEGETTCISASKRDGSIVRVKTMRMNPDHWDYVTIPGDHAAARRYAETQIGTRYNMIGAALSITPITARLGRGLVLFSIHGADCGGSRSPHAHTGRILPLATKQTITTL